MWKLTSRENLPRKFQRVIPFCIPGGKETGMENCKAKKRCLER